MENKFENSRENVSLEKVQVEFGSPEEAATLVEEFWKSMSHGKDLVNSVQDGDWSQELTMGDRTMIVKGVLPKQKGKWIVMFMGNNQPLSKEAGVWLRKKGLTPVA